MATVSAALDKQLKELVESRKKGEISLKEYYKGLISILIDLANSLNEEDISEENIKKQIPLLKVFIMEQIEKMSQRERE